MKKYDLHTHTIYSDGELDVAGNVKYAYNLGLDGIAITDHDNIDSWREIDSNKYLIDVIKGVEITSYYKGDVVHLLGYYKNSGDYSELEKFLENVRCQRVERVKLMIEKLSDHGISITLDDVLKEANSTIARPHIAQAIIKKYPERGYTNNYLFKHYLGDDAPCFVPVNKNSTIDMIELLKRNNCLVVLAHPLSLIKNDYLNVISLGIDGVECFYKYHFRVKRDVYQEVKDLRKVITGGSDFHGPLFRNNMGSVYLEDRMVNDFLISINREVNNG